MSEVIESGIKIPKARAQESRTSKSAQIVRTLQSLLADQCVTLLPDTDHKNDLTRKHVLWCNAAKRAGISVITRSVLSDKGEKAIRIWRTDYP
jgi:hypothetical protein